MIRTACTCLLLALAALPMPLAGQCETLSGEVREGELWQRPFGDGLLFRLRPTTQAPPNPPGWTIEVRAGPNADHDFVWVATPPYRFANPRYLDTSYGRTPSEAVSWSPRSFGFVTSEEHRAALEKVVRFLLWRPPGMTERPYETAYDSVRARWESMLADVGRGELRITGAKVVSPKEHPPKGRIERLAFDVTLCSKDERPGSSDAAAADSTVATELRESASPGDLMRNPAAVPVERVGHFCLDLRAPVKPLTLGSTVLSWRSPKALPGPRRGGGSWRSSRAKAPTPTGGRWTKTLPVPFTR